MSSSPPEKKIKLYDKSSDDKDRIIAELLAKNEQITRERDHEKAEKDRITHERDSEKAEKDRITHERDNEKAEKEKYKNTLTVRDAQLMESKNHERSKSLHAAIVGTHIVKLVCHGSNSSHTNPKNHEAAEMTAKVFAVPDLIAAIEKLKVKTHQDPKLDILGSGLMLQFLPSENQITSPPSYHAEADVVFSVNLALKDALKICNALMSMDRSITPTKTVQLIVRQEMSIFSNRCDHAVVCDKASNAPIFCVETKKHFDDKFDKEEKNKALGQCRDQLKAMQLSGHPFPLGALTCFNETYLTSLSSDIIWDSPPTQKVLQDIVALLPGNKRPYNQTPSPLKMECPVDSNRNPVTAHRSANFVADEKRAIVRSENYIEQNDLVSVFVVIIIQALTGFYVPKPLQKFSEQNQTVEVNCIRMTKKGYKWGKLCTTYQGPFTERKHLKRNLHLIHCIGNGSTSKAYYAITEDGYDCVVKIYVQSNDEQGKLKRKDQFRKDSKKCVSNEKKNYSNIYGKDLCVETRTLNGLDCVIMPFFTPIPVVKRGDNILLQSIQQRLQQIAEKKMAFRDDDQQWQHVGCFADKIFLFDLGDLEQCVDTAAAKVSACNHYNKLAGKSVVQ